MSWTDPALAVLQRLVAQRLTPGAVLAVRRGGVEELRCVGSLALEGPRAAVPVTPDTPFWIASASKPLGAVLAQRVLASGEVSLDDRIDRWVPELASPRVLRDPAGPLDDTEPLARPVTVRDVLAGTAGVGIALDAFAGADGGPSPLFTALQERGVGPGPFANDVDVDTWVARLAELPLACQPGAAWRYHTPHDLLAVLLARATGTPLPELLADRLLRPLGMVATGFGLPGVGRDAVVDVLERDPAGGEPTVVDAPDPSAPPAFPSLAAGLVSTAADLLRFAVDSADSAAPGAMTTPVLTEEQRTAAAPFLEPGTSWGLGVGVDVEPGPQEAGEVADAAWHSPGRWGWVGGTGTSVHVDPAHDVVVVLLTGRMMNGPDDANHDVYRALSTAP